MRCFLATQLQAEWRDTVPGIQKWLVTAKLLLCSAKDFGDSEHRTARPTKRVIVSRSTVEIRLGAEIGSTPLQARQVAELRPELRTNGHSGTARKVTRDRRLVHQVRVNPANTSA